jgi:hypothetical protein
VLLKANVGKIVWRCSWFGSCAHGHNEFIGSLSQSLERWKLGSDSTCSIWRTLLMASRNVLELPTGNRNRCQSLRAGQNLVVQRVIVEQVGWHKGHALAHIQKPVA